MPATTGTKWLMVESVLEILNQYCISLGCFSILLYNANYERCILNVENMPEQINGIQVLIYNLKYAVSHELSGQSNFRTKIHSIYVWHLSEGGKQLVTMVIQGNRASVMFFSSL